MKCPCHSGKLYIECCAPFHEEQNAPTPLDLMRSRYSAYALKKIDYIIATTHPDNPDSALSLAQRKKKINIFCQNTRFLGLDILESTPTTVTFKATLSSQGKDVSFIEKSEFAQLNGRWLYVRPLV